MKKNYILFSAIAGVIIALLMLFKPPTYAAESTFFVPLTFMEKQINQNGIGFGSPIEIDAHIEVLNSNILKQEVENYFGKELDFDISRIRNGAEKVEVMATEAQLDASASNIIIL